MASTASPRVPAVRGGVGPLRAGQRRSFFWRRLHSLTGIIPIGVFLIEHFFSNAVATAGPAAYTRQVAFLAGFPFVEVLELVGIWIPIAYHSLYGFYIWYRGEANVGDYPWQGNWLYTAQRWTGGIAFFYMAYHVWHLRFAGMHILANPAGAFGKVQLEFQNPWIVAFYAIGIVAAAWHFAYGLWLFCAKWGIISGQRAQRRFGYVCLLIALAFVITGGATMYAFLSRPLVPMTPASGLESYTMR
ncbi:MAG: succinate dehydrogenase [Acidobacteria bacterium]|nr:succinate dehydrogenase [Acidobacteriota bacterium]